MGTLNTLQIDTGDNPQTTIIWLHGLGASGHDFEPVVPEFRFSREQPVRFIFPHAPELPVTINGGMVMPAWYDILAWTSIVRLMPNSFARPQPWWQS